MQSKTHWLIDLDNTLHQADYYIYPQINRLMSEYIQTYLGFNEEQSDHIRLLYWRKYGATLIGLMKLHDIDPYHFLDFTHSFDLDASKLLARPNLKNVLGELSGKKIIFSNAPFNYIIRVLSILKIDRLFDDVISIEHTKFKPKPCIKGFREILTKRKINPLSCVMIEDTLQNLRTASRLGVRTIWVSGVHRKPSWLDFRIAHIGKLALFLRR